MKKIMLMMMSMIIALGVMGKPGDINKSVWVGDKYYELIQLGGTWKQCKRDAEGKGGQLACIKDEATNKAVYNALIKGLELSVFIGGYKDYKTGKWMWVDGTEVTFNNWAKNKPDNNLNRSDESAISYNAFWRSKWNDIGKGGILTNDKNNGARPAYYILEMTREQYELRPRNKAPGSTTASAPSDGGR